AAPGWPNRGGVSRNWRRFTMSRLLAVVWYRRDAVCPASVAPWTPYLPPSVQTGRPAYRTACGRGAPEASTLSCLSDACMLAGCRGRGGPEGLAEYRPPPRLHVPRLRLPRVRASLRRTLCHRRVS